ncbi:2,5-diamino-6-(ribosylamino)-4(3H)-pyrimidinone 5'-phosphate reductase [Coemansia sp. RSA 2049]|nr:2,5-diamino-6-(ribosylamino)-4(3H)-pyrimidinone 5'-phosphate reductase [Coemansia sp. RSA 2049]
MADTSNKGRGQQMGADNTKEFLDDAVTFTTAAADRKVSVTVTYAQSQDNMVSKRNEQLILSGPESMVMTHRLRAMHDGILVGINTVLTDDPRLNVRLQTSTTATADTGKVQNPQPIVLDSHLQMPTTARMITNSSSSSGGGGGGGKLPWVFTDANNHPEDKRKLLESLGVQVIAVPRSQVHPQGLCLHSVVAELHARGIRRLMVEGGATVIRSFLLSRIPENLVVTTAPIVVGKEKGVSVPPVSDPSLGYSLASAKYQQLGDDVVMAAKLVYK